MHHARAARGHKRAACHHEGAIVVKGTVVVLRRSVDDDRTAAHRDGAVRIQAVALRVDGQCAAGNRQHVARIRAGLSAWRTARCAPSTSGSFAASAGNVHPVVTRDDVGFSTRDQDRRRLDPFIALRNIDRSPCDRNGKIGVDPVVASINAQITATYVDAAAAMQSILAGFDAERPSCKGDITFGTCCIVRRFDPMAACINGQRARLNSD
ncbi:hypothetical protein D3C85_1313440 [compost metagenome]